MLEALNTTTAYTEQAPRPAPKPALPVCVGSVALGPSADLVVRVVGDEIVLTAFGPVHQRAPADALLALSRKQTLRLHRLLMKASPIALRAGRAPRPRCALCGERDG